MRNLARCAGLLLPLLSASKSRGDEASSALEAKLAELPGGPRPEVLRLALQARSCARKKGIGRPDVLALIDYSLPSTEPRFWVLNLQTGALLFHELVAHGRGSGENLASSFSNVSGSRKSSLGLFLTDETYQGGHGRSLRLKGLEPGFNDAAWSREVVIHSAAYVSPEYAKAHSRIGRSWGCPALAQGVCQRVIETLHQGTLLLAYYPDARWLKNSRYLSCED